MHDLPRFPANAIERTPYSLRVVIADAVSLRGLLIPSNFAYLYGAISYASRIEGPQGIPQDLAADWRAWLDHVENFCVKERTYDSWTTGEKLTIAERKNELLDRPHAE